MLGCFQERISYGFLKGRKCLSSDRSAGYYKNGSDRNSLYLSSQKRRHSIKGKTDFISVAYGSWCGVTLRVIWIYKKARGMGKLWNNVLRSKLLQLLFLDFGNNDFLYLVLSSYQA